jgi:hypothetical protein
MDKETIALALLALAPPTFAAEMEDVVITTVPVAPGIALLSGRGGNSAPPTAWC